jgi:hypothetical protein
LSIGSSSPWTAVSLELSAIARETRKGLATFHSPRLPRQWEGLSRGADAGIARIGFAIGVGGGNEEGLSDADVAAASGDGGNWFSMLLARASALAACGSREERF